MESPGPSYSICYLLDQNDVIVDVGPGWDEFARENDAPDLDAGKVVGRKLIDFVAGDDSRMYVRAILHSARLFRRPLVRTYRCDSPDQRRFMEMRLSLTEDGLLKWEHRLLRTEKMQRRMRFRAAAGGRTAKLTVRCSWCNRLKLSTHWYEPDQAPLPPDAASGEVLVVYGICPTCRGA